MEMLNGIYSYIYDLVAQALAKFEPGHDQDLRDVEAYLEKGLISEGEMLDGFGVIKPVSHRYAALDPMRFEKKVRDFYQHAGTDMTQSAGDD